MVQQTLQEKTNDFFNNIENFTQNNDIPDDGYFYINLCQKLTDYYLSQHEYNISKTMIFFSDILNYGEENTQLTKLIAALCISTTKLRIGTITNDKQLRHKLIEEIEKYQNMLNLLCDNVN